MWARARSIVCHCAQINQVGMEHDIVRALMRVEAWVGGGRVGGRAASLGTGARPRRTGPAPTTVRRPVWSAAVRVVTRTDPSRSLHHDRSSQ